MAIESIGGIRPPDLWRSGGANALGPSASDALGAPSIAIGGIGSGAVGSGATIDAPGQGGSFVDALAEVARGLNTELVGADTAMASFAAGGSADLHAVVLQMQEASLQLKLGVQVRDRLLEAYQDIMRLQV